MLPCFVNIIRSLPDQIARCNAGLPEEARRFGGSLCVYRTMLDGVELKPGDFGPLVIAEIGEPPKEKAFKYFRL